MPSRDKRVDAYIAKSPAFAQPILKHVRDVVHAACPAVEEAMKWSSPTFVYHGKLMVGIAAFKEHCRLIFWKADLMTGAHGAKVDAIGKPRKLSDLPSKRQLTSYVKQSMKIIDEGVTKPPAKRKKPVAVPEYFMAALKRNRKALKTFEAFSPSHRREYVDWITDAKREETRNRRIATAIEWLAGGKPHSWKYIKA